MSISGAALRALRQDRLWSQAELASRSSAFARSEGDRQCGITREAVSKLERGQRSPSPRTLRYLTGALRPTMDDLRGLLGREPPRALADLARDDGPACNEDAPSDWDAWHRRTLLSSWLTVSAAAPDETLRRVARALDRPPQVDDHVLEALSVQSGKLTTSALAFGPALVAPAAAAHLRALERLDSLPLAEGCQQRLERVRADAAALLGWLSWLLDRRAEARDAMAYAVRLARESADRVLHARVLGLLSWMTSTIPTAGQRGDAVTARSLAMRASSLVPEGCRADRVWLIERVACEHAIAGDVRACRSALSEARRLRGDRVVAPAAPGFFGALHAWSASLQLDATAGLCHLFSGEPDEAIVLLRAAVGRADPSDRHQVGSLLADLAAAYVQCGDVDAAGRAAAEAVSLAVRGGFPLDLVRVRGVRRAMPEQWVTRPAIRELDQRLHEAS